MIELRGDWSNTSERETAVFAMHNIGSFLVNFYFTLTKQLVEKESLFEKLFGRNLILDARSVVSGTFHGYVSNLEPRVLQLEIGNITESLIKHEVGHALILTSLPGLNPAELLSATVIRTSTGRPVTGQGFMEYSRDMGYYGTYYTGYNSVFYPHQYHPKYFEEGNNSTEDICDLWLGILTNNIANNDAGYALNSWFISYLTKRLTT